MRSIYVRLLRNHPAMKDNNANFAANGTTVDDMPAQFQSLLRVEGLLPDVVLIQTIDNDIQCDGTDPDHYRSFAKSLRQSLNLIAGTIPDVQLYLTSPWATVENWTAWASHHDEQVAANSGHGPCDVFDQSGQVRPAGMRSMQEIVNYWAALESACAEVPGCFTDGGALLGTTRPGRWSPRRGCSARRQAGRGGAGRPGSSPSCCRRGCAGRDRRATGRPDR